jgi:hypothetical protein
MNRAISSYSDVSSIDEETLLQQELSRLQRQYKIMENERKRNCLIARVTMEDQKKIIQQLKMELTEVDVEMKLASSNKNRRQDRENSNELKHFMEGQDEYSRLIVNQQEEIQCLDRQISEIEEKINAQHRHMGGVHASHHRHVTTQHTIRVLENRLNKATREFNDCLASNAKLREEIQHLRSQRGVFDNIHKRLFKDLIKKKRDQVELIEQSTMAFDQRDEAETKMATLQDRNQKDLAQFNMEYKELMRQLDHDTNLKKFLLDKAQERWEMAEALGNERKKNFEAKSERHAEKTLKEYLNAFIEIKKITGETENEKLVERFIEMEDQNFAMFSYVNEINNQLEQQTDNIKMLENQISTQKADAEETIEIKNNELKQLDAEYRGKVHSETEINKTIKAQKEMLFELKNGINQIFRNTKCSMEQIERRLGNQREVNDQNIMEYLAVIEEMANDMLRRHIVTTSDEDCLAQATVHNDNEDSGPAPVIDELPVLSDEKGSEDKLIHDMNNIRALAKKQMHVREIERAAALAEKPQVQIRDSKKRKNKK